MLLMPVGGSGGVQRVMANLANGLDGLGCSVVAVCCDASEGLPGLKSSVELIDLGKCGLHGDVKVIVSLRAVRALLRRRKPDALITAPGFSGQVGVLAARGLRTRVIVMVDNKLSLLKTLSWKHALIYRTAVALYGSADAVVAAHDAALADLERCLPSRHRAKLLRIYHPLIPDDVKERMVEPVEPAWDALENVAISAGRLVDEKDYETLIRSFALVRKMRDANLVILGDGPLRSHLEELAADLGISDSVHLWGVVDNVYRYFARSSVFVLSSKREAFGNVLIEALACGIPCVATRCASGGPQEILGDGDYGTLVDIGDVEGMACAIRAGLEERSREEKADVQQERVKAFGVKESSLAYLELISKVL